MSDIIIPNAKPPTNCFTCDYEKLTENCPCHIGISSASEYKNNRHPDCPLKEVPTHGDWHTGTPTESENDIYWHWNYAIVLNTEYDCIGDYLAGMLFAPDFERQVFTSPQGEGKEFIVPFEDVVAWQKIEPYKASKETD